MSVCSLTEASLSRGGGEADSLITPLHHTMLLSHCRVSTDEGFLCVCVCVCVCVCMCVCVCVCVCV